MIRTNLFQIIFFGILSCIVVTTSFAISLDTADVKVTFLVKGEGGTPIEGAKVSVGFVVYSGWDSKNISTSGYSDSKGFFTASSKAGNNLGFTVTKDGFYNSTGVYKFTEINNNRWEPWNPEVQVVLRKIGHPVPMYARNTMKSRIQIPAVGKEVAFDLIEFDWVAPYGQGKHSDIIFKLEKNVVSFKEFESTLTVTFPSRFDGIQAVKENRDYGSQLKLPRFAPAGGYQQKLIFRKSWAPGKPFKQTYDKDNNYIIRVRSEETSGKLVRAMYGKIYGDIQFEPREYKTAEIYFTYFLNPDFTRNLEYGVNLFKNLKESERP